MDEAQILFPGYQEFFFLFLDELPFIFGIHLRAHMAKISLNLLSNISPTDLEKKITKLQLVARFLGFLIFSPNWHETGIDVGKVQSLASTDGLQQLESLGVSVVSHVEDAWSGGQLIATIPWATELLRMAKWDSWSQGSNQFRQLLAKLREIQKAIVNSNEDTHSRFGPSMEVVAFFLERLFDETIGLPRLTSLPRSTLAPVKEESSESLDEVCSGFSSIFLYASSPHMEDLVSLVNQIGRGVISKSPSKAKKLRPSIVSMTQTIPNKLFGQGEKGVPPSPINVDWRNINDGSPTTTSENRSIETKLAEAFFHQHREIKGICEFAVDRVLKGIQNRLMIECIQSTFEEEGISAVCTDEELANAEIIAVCRAKKYLENRLEETVTRGLEVFGPEEIHPRVLAVAKSLSVSRGMLSGQSILNNLVSHASKMVQRKKEPSRSKEEVDVASKTDSTSLLVAAIENLASILDASSFHAQSPNATDLLDVLCNTTACIQNHGAESNSSVPSEASLRRIVLSLRRLDRCSDSLIAWHAALTDEDFFHGLSALLRLAISVGTISSFGLRQLNAKLNSTMVLRLLKVSANAKDRRATVIQLLREAIEGNIISSDTIAEAAEMQTSSDYVNAIFMEILSSV